MSTPNELIDLITIDPGEHTGFAAWDKGRLIGALLCAPNASVFQARRVVIEIPLYSDQTIGKRPQDLITLAVRAGRWIERAAGPGADVVELFPAQWKGGVPKKIHNERVLAKLTPAELNLFRAFMRHIPKGKWHNVIDAIGIGLFDLGRMGRGA